MAENADSQELTVAALIDRWKANDRSVHGVPLIVSGWLRASRDAAFLKQSENASEMVCFPGCAVGSALGTTHAESRAGGPQYIGYARIACQVIRWSVGEPAVPLIAREWQWIEFTPDLSEPDNVFRAECPAPRSELRVVEIANDNAACIGALRFAGESGCALLFENPWIFHMLVEYADSLVEMTTSAKAIDYLADGMLEDRARTLQEQAHKMWSAFLSLKASQFTSQSGPPNPHGDS
jgi:hypothetical protein